MSSFYFCKMFKKFAGVNFTEYVSRIRIENARNIATILQEAGGKNKLYLDAEGLGLNVGDSREQRELERK